MLYLKFTKTTLRREVTLLNKHLSGTTLGYGGLPHGHLVHELNYERRGRQACDKYTSLTLISLALLSGRLARPIELAHIAQCGGPGFRNVTFDELRIAYKDNAKVC